MTAPIEIKLSPALNEMLTLLAGAAGRLATALELIAARGAGNPVTRQPPNAAWASPERVALIRDMVAHNRSGKMIAEAINSLPGPPVSANAVNRYARSRNIKRPVSEAKAKHLRAMRAASPSGRAAAAKAVPLVQVRQPFKGVLAAPDPFRQVREQAAADAGKGRL